jgi:hypothetical protein
MSKKQQLNILFTDIGRGHPFYLDGIIESLRARYSDTIQLNVINVFSISHGLSLMLWRFVRWLYKIGSQGRFIGRLYGAIRQGRNSNRYGLIERCLARDIRKYVTKSHYPTLVAHPILVPMISDIVPVYYQHGEIAVPDEVLVKNAEKIFLPLKESKDKFAQAGISEESLITTGLCVEKQLAEKAHEYFNRRISAIKLALDSIKKTGGRAIVFSKKGGNLEKALNKISKIKIIDTDSSKTYIESIIKSENISAVLYKNRQEENNLTYSLYKDFDYFAAPSHERTNWAVGLGLPMFILHPLIGTFSPLNRQFLLNSNVAFDIDTDQKAINFAAILSKLGSDGILLKMAQNGFNKYNIDGFEKIAANLLNELM